MSVQCVLSVQCSWANEITNEKSFEFVKRSATKNKKRKQICENKNHTSSKQHKEQNAKGPMYYTIHTSTMTEARKGLEI